MGLTQVNSEGIKDGEIKNADLDSSAAIDGSKLAAATTSAAGSMSAADKTKLDGVATSATANPSAPALTGSTDNTICTVTGANAIQGEANLTFDGDTLQLTETGGDSADGARLDLKFGNNNTTDVISSVTFSNGTGEAARIQGETSGANNSGVITFHTDNAGTSAERMRIRQDGHVEIKDGNLTIETAGHGINFHPHGGSNENLLDDYEEGTWDVVVTGAESGATSTYSDTGWYTKVGRVVHCHVKLHNVTFPALGGRLDLSAPFTAKNDIIARGGPAYWEPTSVWDDYTDMVGIQAVIPQSANQFYLDVMRKDQVHTSQSAGSGGRNGNLSEASGVYLQFTITYFI